MFRTLKWLFRDFPGPLCFLTDYHLAKNCLKTFLIYNWYDDIKKSNKIEDLSKDYLLRVITFETGLVEEKEENK